MIQVIGVEEEQGIAEKAYAVHPRTVAETARMRHCLPDGGLGAYLSSMAPKALNVPLDSDHWEWGGPPPVLGEHRGEKCLCFPESFTVAAARNLSLTDGVIQARVSVPRARSFHGLVWRCQDRENYESFFVRPHQVGNPDSIQYTPVFNDVSCWQLYHGEGFWAPILFPIDEWFVIRVAFAGQAAEVYVEDLARPVLRCELKASRAPGRVGILCSGPGLRVAGFSAGPSADPTDPAVQAVPRPHPQPDAGAIRSWWISSTVPEAEIAGVSTLAPGAWRELTWDRLDAEPSGLANIARVRRIEERRNTVFATAVIRSSRQQRKALAFGFSDRATVFLNGRALFRGEDAFRSRDYRFLGSVGYWDTVYLPLDKGENQLVIAVSEDFGGWGVQARFADREGIELPDQHDASGTPVWNGVD